MSCGSALVSPPLSGLAEGLRLLFSPGERLRPKPGGVSLDCAGSQAFCSRPARLSACPFSGLLAAFRQPFGGTLRGFLYVFVAFGFLKATQAKPT